jgi:hypothetical protein
MADPARKIDDEPLDPAEEPMPEAAFEIIQRAHELCGHPPAVDLTVDLEQRAEQALNEARAILRDLDAETEPAAPIFSLENSEMDDEYDRSTFAAACRKADAKARAQPVSAEIRRARRLLDDSVSLERAYSEIHAAAREAIRKTGARAKNNPDDEAAKADALPYPQPADPAPPPPDGQRTVEGPLGEVLESLRRQIADRSQPIKQRIHRFWAIAKGSRDLAASDVLTREFRRIAYETKLVADLGWHGAEDVRHVLDWALRGMNPFETGPLR